MDPELEYYLLLSQIQFTPARIDYYTKNPDKLAKRALHVPAGELNNKNGRAILFLTDYIGIAFYLREQFDKHVQSYEKYTTDYTKAQRRYYAALVCAVADAKPKVKDWINYTAVTNERDENNREYNERRKGICAAEAHLKDWKLSDSFKIAFEDGKGIEDGEKLMLAQAAYLTSLDEITYLSKVLDDDKSWLNQLFLIENAFLLHRKLTTLINEPDAQGLLAQFLVGRYLAKYSPVISKSRISIETMVNMQKSYIKEIQLVFDKIDKNLFSSNLNKCDGNWFFIAQDTDSKMPIITADFKGHGQIKGRANLNKDVYNQARANWNTTVGKVIPVLQWSFAGIEAVNLANAHSLMLKTQTLNDLGFNLTNLIGSFADFTSSLKFIGEGTLKDFYLKTGKAAFVAEKSAERVFARVNLIGSICDFIGASNELSEAAEKGYTGQAAGQAVIALASAATGAGAAVAIVNTSAAIAAASAGAGTAAGTSATFIGLSAGPLGLIGIGLFLAGATIVWYFSDEELRIWAKRCLWAKIPDDSYILIHQIYSLHRIICNFEVSCYMINRLKHATLGTPQPQDFENSFTIKINPGYFKDENSKYSVSLSITREGGLFGKDSVIFDRTVEISSIHCQIIHSAFGIEKVLLYRITFEEINLPVTATYDVYTYKLEAQLDFEGNGTIKFPDEKTTKSGTLARVKNDMQV